jgi:hypothetical protein
MKMREGRGWGLTLEIVEAIGDNRKSAGNGLGRKYIDRETETGHMHPAGHNCFAAFATRTSKLSKEHHT